MIKFADKYFPSYIKVTDVKYSILPPIESKTEQVYGRAGVYDFGIELGERKIEVEIMIIADNQNDVIKKARDFSKYLYYKDLQPLIILDEPDKQYMARVTGETDVTELFRTGTATIVFTCPSPYAESLTEKVVNYSPIDYTPIQINNNGSAETYPVIDLTLREDATSIAVLNSEKFVKVGEDVQPEQTAVAVNPIVLNEPFDTYTGWTTASVLDNGTIEGTFTSTGSVVQQTGKDYGSGSDWHGAAGVKSLPKTLANFKVTAKAKLSATNINQIGRLEIYLLDINNVVIGKLALVDSYATGHYTRVEARAGAWQGGYYFVNSFGTKKGVLNDYDGILEISRVGQQWSAYFAKVNSKGVHTNVISKVWYDTSNSFSTKQLAKIQIHAGALGSYTPVSTMYFSDLKVYDKTSSVDYSTQVPILFKAGDVVTVDNQKAIVLKNGQAIFQDLDPSSDFFALDVGANGLMVSPPIADVSVRYKERWL
ncbi:hypothetical protein CHCC14819_0444 [Bacillus licheniformis]|uniref:distal tail protein Dit n=1 Tax=Bacillus licheniformis TaxID=1402 RepID=UPI0011A3335B|nr:distal tail protein Dit [Bacillus licheniformis]TWM32248.1 hypothetical protein CHCC14819_0444 [Bacillus licheniformis]